MKGYVLLSDGTRLEGVLRGVAETAVGWLAANTAVVGFQEMATDPAYKGRILAFTYPEIGNVGVAEAFSESSRVQVAALVVKVLSETRSHYLSEGSLEDMLAGQGVPCLTGVDTRGLAVHLREHGEMAAAVAPADRDAAEVEEQLASLGRPAFEPSEAAVVAQGSGPRVAVLNLGVRSSQVRQLAARCTPVLFPHDAEADAIRECAPAGVFVSDGPGCGLPPEQAVATIAALAGEVPMLCCGLGNVALGMALGCEPDFLRRGHHGANCPVRNLADGTAEVTQQRHTVLLDRRSVEDNPRVELLWENMNDGTVEGIRTPDMRATGMQAIGAAPQAGAVNVHMQEFLDGLAAAG